MFLAKGRVGFVVLLIAFVWAPLARAQESTTSAQPSRGALIVQDLNAFVEDGVTIFTAPLHFGGSEWLATAGVVGVTAGMIYTTDLPVRHFMLNSRSSAADHIADFGNYFGTGVIGGVAAVGLYGTGLVIQDSGIRVMGRHIVQALAYSGIITTAIKALAGRDRPYLNQGPKSFNGPLISDASNSLPSGHVTVAAAICSSLAEDINNNWVRAGLYTIAGTTIFARMYTDKHWSSDVFLAGVIGTVCGYWTVHLHDGAPKNWSLAVTPLWLSYEYHL